MRFFRTVVSLMFLGLLLGCNTGTRATTAVDTASQPANRYAVAEAQGTPILVDSETGRAWKYDAGAFVPVAVQGLPAAETNSKVRCYDATTQKIGECPATQANFAGPVRRYNPQTGKIE